MSMRNWNSYNMLGILTFETKTTKKQQTPNTEDTTPAQTQENTVEVQPQDIVEVNPENVQTTTPDEISKNYDFFNQVQNVKPYSSNGGSKFTPSTAQQNAKRKKKNHMQRISRRLNKNR